jgi:hypothetical protein
MLDIVHRPVFHLNQRFGDWFCLRLQVEPTQVDPIETASLWLHLKDGDRISLRNEGF